MTTKTVIPPYTGWRPRSMRFGKSRHEGDRGSKRKRMGNREDRAIYTSAKGWKHPRYGILCALADSLNKMDRRT